ncbi:MULTISPECIES: hypothetical protein [unclassified Microcoleus]|uniref:hypothetical protein n=1 Tax=unclassified Microcoleus TaxID=2642155 RepID=UPI002FD6D22C
MRSLSLDRLEKERGVEDAIALWETARSLGKRKGDRPLNSNYGITPHFLRKPQNFFSDNDWRTPT